MVNRLSGRFGERIVPIPFLLLLNRGKIVNLMVKVNRPRRVERDFFIRFMREGDILIRLFPLEYFRTAPSYNFV